MAGEMEQKNSMSPAVPFLLGGLLGGAVAIIFAPRLNKARDAVWAAGRKACLAMSERKQLQKGAKPQEEGIYCAVPEGADICFDEKSGA